MRLFRKFLDCTKRSPFILKIFCNRMDVKNPKRFPLYLLRHCDTVSAKFFNVSKWSPLNFFSIFYNKKMFVFQIGEKKFPSLIEHEKHPLGVSKLFSELFIKTFCHILKTLRFLSFCAFGTGFFGYMSKSPKSKSPKLKSPRLKSPKLKSPRPKSPRSKSPKIRIKETHRNRQLN